MEMRINSPKKRSPFSEPLKPLVGSRHRIELEEIRLSEKEESPVSQEREEHKTPTKTTGFTAVPVEEEQEPPIVAEPSLSSTHAKEDPTPRWKFWKRPSKKDQQMALLKEGCQEMVSIMRSMREDIAQSKEERVGVKTSLSPLPVAVASLRSLSKTQEKTGEILSELKTCVEQSAYRETRVAESLGTFNETMASVGRTFVGLEKRSERSVEAMHKLTKRVEESDRMFNEMFERLRQSEHEFAEQLGRASQRGAFITVSACGLLSMAMIFMVVTLNEQRRSAQLSKLPIQAAPAHQIAEAKDVQRESSLGNKASNAGE